MGNILDKFDKFDSENKSKLENEETAKNIEKIKAEGERVKEELGEDTETTKDSIDTDKEQETKDNEPKELSEKTPVEEVKEDEQTTKDKVDTESATETEKESTENTDTENTDTEKATETETTETEPKDLEEESHEDKSVDTIESNESVSTETNDTESGSPVDEVVEKSAKQSKDPVDHKNTKTEDKDNEKRKNKDNDANGDDDSDSESDSDGDDSKDDSKSDKTKKSYIEELAERVLGSLEKSAKRQDELEKSILDLQEKLNKQETETTEKSIASGLSDSPNVETTEKSITNVDQNSDKGYVEKGFTTDSDSTKEQESKEQEPEKEETGLEFAEKHAEQYQEKMRKAFENGQRNEVSRAQTSWYRLRTGYGNEQDKQVVKSFLK